VSLKGDYAAMARALELTGSRSSNRADCPGAVDRALAHPGPALLEVAVKPLEARPWR